MIHMEGVCKSFGRVQALRGVDLEVAGGEFLAVVGPNGAGKTTLLRLLAGLLRPSSGRFSVNGEVWLAGDAEARRAVGFVPHGPMLYGNLTVAENLRFFGKLYDVPALEERLHHLLQLFGLQAYRHSTSRSLSRGMQQRLSLARCLLHEPRLLLLDEPFSALDQAAIAAVQRLLRGSAPRERTVIMATHGLEQALELCDRLAILHRGRVVYVAEKGALTLEGLRQAYRHHTAEGSE